MERLTKDNGKAFEPFRYSLEDISTYKIYDLFYEITFKVLQKLGKYEDAEEQGLLLGLPCKPRSEVFLICNRYTHCSFEDVSFEESSCEGCEYDCDSRKELYIHRNSSVDIEWITRNLNKFGKTVFLTKEEAEAKLAEMEEKDGE